MSAALRIVRDSDVPGDASFDDTLKRIEAAVAKTAEHDTILWGGPNRKGIVPSIDTLADTVARLADSVAKLTQRVTGEDGLTVDIRDLKAETKALREDAARLEEVRRERASRNLTILFFVLSPLYVGLIGLVGRALWFSFHGVPIP